MSCPPVWIQFIFTHYKCYKLRNGLRQNIFLRLKYFWTGWQVTFSYQLVYLLIVSNTNISFVSELQQRFFEDFVGGHWCWIHDFVATFRIDDRPIYMVSYSWGWPLDTGSRPSVVGSWWRFQALCSGWLMQVPDLKQTLYRSLLQNLWRSSLQLWFGCLKRNFNIQI